MLTSIRVDFGLLSGIYIGLILFGIGFDSLTAWLERKGYMEGFTSLLVAIGVAATLTPFVLLDLPAVTIIGGFICSGAPMMIGSISRYIKLRARAQAEIARLHGYGDEPPGMAQ